MNAEIIFLQWLDTQCHGFGWTPGVGDGQGGLACCSSWGYKESDTTELLNWTHIKARGLENPSSLLLRKEGFSHRQFIKVTALRRASSSEDSGFIQMSVVMLYSLESLCSSNRFEKPDREKTTESFLCRCFARIGQAGLLSPALGHSISLTPQV